MSLTNQAMNVSYGVMPIPATRGGSVTRGGSKLGSLVNTIKRANQWAKDNKVITRADTVLNAIGLADALDAKTGGLYKKGVNKAKTAGYGRRRKRGRPKKH